MKRLTRTQAGGILVILAAAVVGGNSAADAPGPRRHEVAVEGLEFSPSRLSVGPGDTVVWRNEDLVPHTVTATDGGWDGGGLDRGEVFRLVVPEGSDIEYFCQYHPRMTGILEVADR